MKYVVNSKKEEKDWFRLKQYPHIGLPLEPKDRAWIEPYVKNKKAIAKHAFYPFIHRSLKVRKFRREVFDNGTRSVHRVASTKTRDINFSNHLDSKVFSYYADILTKGYENLITDLEIGDCITAYRRIKVNPTDEKSRNKCNIDFANDLFQYIKSNNNSNLVAITFDIEGFFDNLDHSILKRNWRRLIKSGADLPPDHYNVYRNITKFSYVEEEDLFQLFKDRIVVEREPKTIKRISVKKKKYLRNKRAIAYCYLNDMREIRNAGLIKSNKYIIKENGEKTLRNRGIPQGSPISATLANIYMVDFDKTIYSYIQQLGGMYQRYSDDMVVVCPVEHEGEVIEYFLKSIKEYKLNIQREKTQIFHFKFNKDEERHFCFEKNLKTNKLQNNTTFEYLGFQFDGFFTLIKSASLSNYYRKMKRDFARSRFYTFHNKTSTKGELFKNRLYKSYTHIGANRRRIYKRHPSKSNLFIKTLKFDWGNFISYTNLAEKTIPDNKIKAQMKSHWKKFHELINEIERK